jgi:tocopherol O-methyltransferase
MENPKAHKCEVAKFYNTGSLVCEMLVYQKTGFNNHYGFWYRDTKSLKDAAQNEIQAVISRAGISKGDLALDAGCGVGGSAIFIAKTTGAKVVGISLSSKEVSRATRNAKKEGASDLVKFEVQDYTSTRFPSNHFDFLYGIESICHACPKIDMLNEAYRILKPGGKIVISDGYLMREIVNEHEDNIVNQFLYGFAMKELITRQMMAEQMRQAGFSNITFESKIKEIIPSVKYFSKLAKRYRLIGLALKNLHPALLTMHRYFIAAISADEAIKINLADYCIHCAEKPTN